MIKSKAIDIIKKFSGEEKESFKLFLESPYLNKKKKILELYLQILKNFDKIEEKDSTEEKIFAGLFKGKEFSYSFLRNLMSELLEMCEKFLVTEKMFGEFDSDFQSNLILLQEFNKRFLDNLYEIKRKKILKVINDRKIDFNYYNNLSLLEYSTVQFHLDRTQMKNVPEHLISRSEYDICYIARLLGHDINDLHANMTAFNLDFKSELVFDFINNFDIENFLESIKDKKSRVHDEISIWLRAVLQRLNRSEKNYFELKKIIIRNIDKYSNSEKYDFCVMLRNFCGQMIVNGNKNFYKELYFVFKFQCMNVKFKSDGVGPFYGNNYVEIINYAAKENDLEFANYFLDNFTKMLEDSKQISLYNYGMAVIEFENKNFDKTLEHLAKVEPYNFYVKNFCKSIYLKTFYELKMFEQGFSFLDSYLHFIKDTAGITDKKKKYIRKNHRIFYTLFKMRSESRKFNDYEFDKLIKEINSSGLNYIEWFLEKVKELRG